MRVPAAAPRGLRTPPARRCEDRAVLDTLLLVCAAIAIAGTLMRVGLAAAVPAVRPRRIEWDDPA